jgi:hypothetical protein
MEKVQQHKRKRTRDYVGPKAIERKRRKTRQKEDFCLQAHGIYEDSKGNDVILEIR